MTTKPRIVVSDDAKDKSAIKTVKSLLKAAIRRLDNARAWPIENRGYAILLVAGQAVNIKYSRPKTLNWDTEPFELLDLHIAIGEHFLSSDMFNFFREAKLVDIDVVTFLLAHEIFHLTEIQRQNAWRFPAAIAGSGFASSVRSEMSPEWAALAKDLATAFNPIYRVPYTRFHKVPSDNVIRAHDAVSETCADLMALEIVAPLIRNIKELRDAAVAFRVAEEAAGNGNYQCGTSMAALAPQCAGQAPGTIVGATWGWALAELILAPDVPFELKNRAQNIKLLLEPSMPPLPDARKTLEMAIRWLIP